jgi:hypothetical protein
MKPELRGGILFARLVSQRDSKQYKIWLKK